MFRGTTKQALLLPLLLAACSQSPAPRSAAATQPVARPVASAEVAPPSRPGNFNALAQSKVVIGAAAASAAVPAGTPRAPVHMNERLGVPSFLWAQPGAASGAVAAKAPAATGAVATAPRGPREAARAHLAAAAPAYGLSAADAAKAVVTKVHDTGFGPIIVTFRQYPGGLEVFREEASVAMARDLSLVAVSGAISPAAAAASARAGFALDGPAALAAALTDLTGQAFAATDFAPAGAKGRFSTYALLPAVAAARGERFARPAGVKQLWFRMPTGLVPAWQVEVAVEPLGGEALTYGSVISAADGALLFRKDHREADAFSYRVWASDPVSFLPDDGPQGLAGTPHPTGTADGYQAPFVAQRLVTLQNVPFSRNDPWLDPGSAFTFGNNVLAYADLSAPDHYVDPSVDPTSLDVAGRASAPGAFDFLYDTAAAPAATPAQVQAAIVQLFYDNNALHDWYYDAGFDEAAGNAQLSNYGRGGVEGDPLLAEAQDFSGTNNANMSTPPDGFSPWMQMYVWNNSDLLRLITNAPASIAGTTAVATAAWGPGSFDLTGDAVYANPLNGCGAFVNAAAVAGKIAVVDRGVCSFDVKAYWAEQAGAVGVLVANNRAGLSGMALSGTTPGGVIPALPSLMILQSVGTAFKAELAAGNTPNVTMQRLLGTMRDGTIDNLIVAHEWGHYISNRLVQDSAGLDTIQARGMGEGFGDFHALLLAVREDDVTTPSNAGWNGVYGTAGYVGSGTDGFGAPNQAYYYGIRRTPYSTDMTRAPFTFRHVTNGVALPVVTPPLQANGNPNAEVHNIGEIWANTLWECYASLLRATQGPAPRLTFAEANRRMRAYTVAAYKLMPQSPTMLEGRDAFLAAAFAGDRADFDAFWAAFAKRGFGVGAVAPPRFTTTNVGVVESFTTGGDMAFVSATFGQVTTSCDDRDGKLDNGETGTLTITLRNVGATPLPPVVASIASGSAALTFPGGAAVNVGASAAFGTATATVQVKLANAAFRQVIPLQVSFPAGYLAAPTVVGFDLVVNYDVMQVASATDDFEGDRFLWQPSADPQLWHATGWIRDLGLTGSSSDHALFGPDPDAPSDQRIVSPPLQVGSGPFSIEWDHVYGFESDGAGSNFDGGVVELSQDGGATWVDVGGPLYTGTIFPYAGNLNPLQDGTTGRPAFVDFSPAFVATGAFDHAVLDLGTTYAGKTVQVRFRIGSDNGVGSLGWLVDNVAFKGISNKPFDLITHEGGCFPPVAVVGADQVVNEGAAVTLDGSGSFDPDGGAISYAWVQTAGPAVLLSGAAGATPTFTAPAVGADTTMAFLLTVSDGQFSASATTLVTVRHLNRAPVASAGAAFAADERTLVTLDGSGSTDPDAGTVLTYTWTQSGGPAGTPTVLTGQKPAFLAPEVTADTPVTFSLTVSDGLLTSPPATVVVTIRNVNRAPLASAGATQSVGEGAAVSLDASASSDPDAGTTLTFAWTQTAGPTVALTGATTASPGFTAPPVDANTLLTFAVTVSDGALSSSASVDVLVRHVNKAPVANAGTGFSAPERTTVTLDASASTDADPGTVLAYAWTQTAGPAVELLGAGSARPAFVAPEVTAAGATLTFSVVVSDGLATSAPATVNVAVENVNLPPTVTAGAAFSAPERTEVALLAVGADPDAGTTLGYAWTQAGGPAVVLTSPDTAAPTFTAPEVTAATPLTFSVTVSDGEGGAATSQVVVTITQVNRPPVAAAGPAQTVNEGTPVTLDAGASTDPDAGATLGYSWTQLSGPPVALSGATTARPSFTAPGGDATLTFQVTVSDGASLSTATATVTVKATGSSGGCGCSAQGSNPAGLVPFLFGLAFLRRRRVRPAAG